MNFAVLSKNHSLSGRNAEHSAAAMPAGDSRPGPFRETRFGWMVLAAVWVICGVYMATCLTRGWIPFDAGTLAEEALRTLHGQVPHRDFIEVYTGGLTYLNALSFRLFGINLLSLRILLFLFFLAWLPSVYLIARRFTGPIGAGLVTLLSVAWSLPNYPDAMPSWYNLFFDTWGTLALLRYVESEKRRWIWVAGICGGISFLFKISGLYFVAGVLLFLVYRESRSAGPATGRGRASVYAIFVTGGLMLYLVALASLIATRPTASNFANYVLPSACLAGFLVWDSWRKQSVSSGARLRGLLSTTTSFLGGAMIPVTVFLAWYASQGALRDWWVGTFIRPVIHTLLIAKVAFFPLAALFGVLPGILILAAAYDPKGHGRRLSGIIVPVLLLGLLLASWKSVLVYAVIGFSASLVILLIALAVPIALGRSQALPERKRQQAFLLAAVAVNCALIQFPLGACIYLCYVAPLVIVSILALFSLRPPKDRAALGWLTAFYLIFALWLHPPGYFDVLPFTHQHRVEMASLDLPRAGGIRMERWQSAQYVKLIRIVQAHANGPYIYCTADCPQVYFLSQKRNPTPDINEYLLPDFLQPLVRADLIPRTLVESGVNLVVLQYDPNDTLSGPIPAALTAALDKMYPLHETVGHFDVRWKPSRE